MLKVLLPRLGITTTFVDPDDPKNFTDAIQENTRLFFAESLGNPKLDVLDLKGISREAKAAKVPFMVDSTLATPALQNPIAYGVNIVIHSLTKYANGNGSTMGGVIVDAGNFDWSGQGIEPLITRYIQSTRHCIDCKQTLKGPYFN